MNWEQCRNYGMIEINPVNNTIKLFYNQWSYALAGNPLFINVENATWQGNNLIVRGYDQYGQPKGVVMNSFNTYIQIF